VPACQSSYQARAAETPAVLDHNQASDLAETLRTLGGFSVIVIDSPGIDSHATRGAMRAANLCLVPVRPSEADLKATMPTIKALHALAQPFASSSIRDQQIQRPGSPVLSRRA
jgi:chromosome partitioning protein